MATVQDCILALLARILRAGGFGRIEIVPETPLGGATATIQVKPNDAEQKDLTVLLSRLANDFEYAPARDRLELTYERGTLTLVRIVFPA